MKIASLISVTHKPISKKRGTYNKPPCSHGNKKKDCRECKRRYNYEYRIKNKRSRDIELFWESSPNLLNQEGEVKSGLPLDARSHIPSFAEFCAGIEEPGSSSLEQLSESPVLSYQVNGDSEGLGASPVKYQVKESDFCESTMTNDSEPPVIMKASPVNYQVKSDSCESGSTRNSPVKYQVKGDNCESGSRVTPPPVLSIKQQTKSGAPFKRVLRTKYTEERDKQLGPVVTQKYTSPGADPKLFSVFKL